LQAEERKTAEAQRESAQAQLALNQYVGVVAKVVNPRVIDVKRFKELMKGHPKATAEIWYGHGDGESEMFANSLNFALGKNKSGIGWDTTIKPFAKVTDPALPFIRQDAGANGSAYAGQGYTRRPQ
jgi:hypothetical protein